MRGAGRSSRSTRSPGRCGCGAGRRSRTCRCRRAHPGRRVRRRTSSRRRSCASGGRCSRATAATRTSRSSCAASRRSAARACSARGSRRWPARPRGRGLVPLRPGPARRGEDVDGRAAHHAPDRARQAGRDRLAEPQGDPQAALRDRGRRARGGRHVRGLKKATRGTPSRSTESALVDNVESAGDFDDADHDLFAGTAWLFAARSSTASSTTSSSTRRARPRSPTRSRSARARGRSSCSATRCSSRR